MPAEIQGKLGGHGVLMPASPSRFLSFVVPVLESLLNDGALPSRWMGETQGMVLPQTWADAERLMEVRGSRSGAVTQ